MTPNDFASAQQRVLARQQGRSARAQTAGRPLTWTQDITQTWESIKGREGTRPAFRVGQLDSELLDDELLQLLKGQIGEGLKFFGVSFQFHLTIRQRD